MAKSPVFDLSGRTALITGASSGIGFRLGRIMAESGARVVLAARRVDRLEALAAQISANGGQAIALPMDVTDEASTIAAYDAAEAAFGTVDTIIANAGTTSTVPVTTVSVADYDQLMAVNMRGVFLTVREGARRLIASGSAEKENGRVVITASITALMVEAGLSLYSASKAGVIHMGKVMARDWARKGVNVNMVCPGYIRTEINDEWFETEGGKKQIARWPRRRLMEENDLDAMILYLASDAARAVTGAAFTIDDGQSL